MTNETFFTGVATNEKRITCYKSGGDGRNGGCDCIGLIIGAIRLEGGVWPWTHGSNYTARYLLADGIQINAPLHIGDLVFKGKHPNDTGYDLPDRYKKGEDLTDYYHVGVVTSLSPLCIAHCTSGSGCRIWDGKAWVKAKHGGMKFDSSRGAWRYSGRLKMITGEQAMTGTVTSPNGGKVNMRVDAKLTASIVAKLPVGTEVEILGTTNTGWTRCQYGAKTGYIMSQFIEGSDSGVAIDSQRKQAIALIQQGLDILKAEEG